MIDLITREALGRLADTSAEHCVSIYLPTHRVGPGAHPEDGIRFKNLIGRAAAELVELGVRGPDADELLAPATALLDDHDFWAHLDDGLAVLLTAGGIDTWRLPEPVPEVVVVADRFHLKPLIPAVAAGTAFHVLALSQNHVRLLRGNRTHLAEVGLGAIPPSLAEVVRYDDREAQLHSHGAVRTGRGRVTASFHGQGGVKDTAGDEIRRFLGTVDDGLADLLGRSPLPLVLAGVEDLVNAFRKVSRHPNLVDATIAGNPDVLGIDGLHARAWELIAADVDAARAADADGYLGAADPVACGTAEVVSAAADGRVRTLFVPADTELWGTFDRDAHRVVEHDRHEAGDRDLADLAAVATLANGGVVHVTPSDGVPGEGPLAALLRY